jgi:hypothetical protein
VQLYLHCAALQLYLHCAALQLYLHCAALQLYLHCAALQLYLHCRTVLHAMLLSAELTLLPYVWIKTSAFLMFSAIMATVFIIFVSQSFPLLPVHSRCRGCLFSLDHTQTHTAVSRTPLDEGSARRRNLYLTTQTLYKRQTSMPPVGFESTIPASARPQTYALDRAATGIGLYLLHGADLRC